MNGIGQCTCGRFLRIQCLFQGQDSQGQFTLAGNSLAALGQVTWDQFRDIYQSVTRTMMIQAATYYSTSILAAIGPTMDPPFAYRQPPYSVITPGGFHLFLVPLAPTFLAPDPFIGWWASDQIQNAILNDLYRSGIQSDAGIIVADNLPDSHDLFRGIWFCGYKSVRAVGPGTAWPSISPDTHPVGFQTDEKLPYMSLLSGQTPPIGDDQTQWGNSLSGRHTEGPFLQPDLIDYRSPTGHYAFLEIPAPNVPQIEYIVNL